MKRFLLVLPALALSACNPQPEGEPVVRTEFDGTVAPAEPTTQEPVEMVETDPASACQPDEFEGVSLTHCIADPDSHTIRTALAPSSGENFGTIEAWAVGKNESAIAFVMNGGMFGDDLKPIGYYVEEAERLEELNRGDGDGNFYLKPNGVFFGTNGSWRIDDTETFLRTVGTRPQFGTQSGPMLVLDGDMHPEFQDNGPSRQIRNGVGIDGEGRAHFVISNDAISFGQFARYFRDELETANALYLDGNISSLWHPASGRMDSRRVGPLIVVEKK